LRSKKAGQQSKFFVILCLSLSFSYAYIHIQCLYIVCICIFRLDLDHTCIHICLLFNYSYNYITNCQFFYIYGHTYLSVWARVINWSEEGRKKELGKKTKMMLERWGRKDNTKSVRHRRRGCMYIHIDKKEYIGVTTLTHTHCIIMMNTLVIIYWRRETKEKSQLLLILISIVW